MKLENEMWAYALKNAIEYGRAVVGKVLPKLFNHGLDKKDIGKIMPSLQKIVDEVNKMSVSAREKEFEKFKGFVKEREVVDKMLPDIDISGLNEVVTRIAPEPSKYAHIGHAISFLLNYQYARKYNGKCFLRFEDTNPEKVSQEYVDAMKEDVLNYLGIKVDGVKFISDDMEILYDYARKLIGMNRAYMCFCDRNKMQDLRHKGQACDCRRNSRKNNLDEWKKFVDGKYTKGEAVLRIKGNMKSKNHVMRDSVLFRAIPVKHYRQGDKYKVWPMYDFYNPIEDSLMGVTLILRSNEFDLRIELQDKIKDLLGLRKQKIIQYGRFNVIDFTTQGREIRELVESGELVGWDDPRLITLRALRRRGITKEAIYGLVEQVGLSRHQVNLDFDMIASINRKIIDARAKRYFFVQNPIGLIVNNRPNVSEVELKVHPDFDDTRKLKVGQIYISREDFEEFSGKEIRLLHLFNIQLNRLPNATFTTVDNKDVPRIQWVSDYVDVRIFMPNGNFINGFGDIGLKSLSVGELIQFERFGFCRLDKKEKENKKVVYEFWFTHK